ncbi:2-amino-4-hydroxy-6-hydroxymethyldihydropteridine diphosphokinase [Curtobacterium sp. VKM Ac-2922]|uniref:2-amino-4-hydroxy-6- hydroxymethyldihydropteridine diphosphokinase n=1 Tax=Curtobacterium sp. VKM Ac-2922 TaxID=2929475 RepID=UPI001FB48F0B|nr:2-amino-4-hydroxy-6-hydroxymethyldihydropteridine diphosphokinase [Curtobacterium sp. VKM Ac-2922]MCJ1715059.1 2-amino-4-hydroxy-6-hydroxymethyldihydropteridine diphosphokinase [Curtobacterium sp. VKM Ac-2922]
MTRAVIALGANLGDRGSTLRAAASAVAAIPGVHAVASSHEVESVALTLDGLDTSKPRYRNAVVVVDTELGAQQLLDALHAVEDAHGRTRQVRWGDRTLDLDVVTYGDAHIATETLDVPHPRAHERAFVLAPWLDADPDAVLPGRGPVADLLAALGDDTERVDEPRLFDDATTASRPDETDRTGRTGQTDQTDLTERARTDAPS